MAFRPKQDSSGLTRLLSVQFLNFPFCSLSVILSTVMRAECETWAASFDISDHGAPRMSGLGLSCKTNQSRVPPGVLRSLDIRFPWKISRTSTQHIKMFMRSLAMSGIQPLGHKLPKALNLIHKDIGQLLNNPRYFISIVMTTSM